MRKLSFYVPGIPVGAGSKRAFPRKGGGGTVLVDTSGKRGKNWRAVIQTVASIELGDAPLMRGPLILVARFEQMRPKSHYGTGRNAGVLKAGAPLYPTSPPDTTKLLRAVEDALNGVLWEDDRLVVIQQASKVYAAKAGVHITVKEMT